MTLVSLLAALEEYNESQACVATEMRRGVFDITKARQSKGQFHSISAEDVRSDLSASVRVVVSSDGAFRIVTNSSSDDDPSLSSLPPLKDEPQKSSSSLRNRKKNNKNAAAPSSSSSVPLLESESDDNHHHVSFEKTKNTTSFTFDPIDLFGALPPKALRTAQSSFASALNDCIVAANHIREVSETIIIKNESEEKNTGAAAANAAVHDDRIE
jgi:hypothetical protein